MIQGLKESQLFIMEYDFLKSSYYLQFEHLGVNFQ